MVFPCMAQDVFLKKFPFRDPGMASRKLAPHSKELSENNPQ